MNPAPADALASRTGSRHPVGAPLRAGSAGSDRWVLAMQTGKPPKPFFSYMASCPEAAISVTGLSVACLEISRARGMVMFVAAPRIVEVAASSGAVSGSRVDDRLRLGEALHRITPADPAAPAHRAGTPAERQVGLPQVGRGVDVHP